jgi:hypothetical protein
MTKAIMVMMVSGTVIRDVSYLAGPDATLLASFTLPARGKGGELPGSADDTSTSSAAEVLSMIYRYCILFLS